MIVVSTIRTFVDLIAHSSITIGVSETSLTGASERSIGIRTGGRIDTVVGENISASAFADVLTDVVSVCKFLQTSVADTVVATVIIFSRVIWALSSSIRTFIDIEKSITTIHGANTISIVSSTFETKVDTSRSGEFITRVLTEDAFVFLNTSLIGNS